MNMQINVSESLAVNYKPLPDWICAMMWQTLADLALLRCEMDSRQIIIK